MNHIIWLVISFFIVFVLILLTKKFKWGYNAVLNIAFFGAIISEIIVFSGNIVEEVLDSGYSRFYVSANELPFHLCGIAIILILMLKTIFKNNGKAKDLILGCLWFPCIVGAFLSLLFATQGTTFVRLQTYEYFIWHSILIYFGIEILIQKWVVIDWKRLLKNYAFFAILTYFAFIINSVLREYNTNYFYLCGPPIQSGVFMLNLKYGYGVYLIHLISIACILLFLSHLPFIIINKKSKK